MVTQSRRCRDLAALWLLFRRAVLITGFSCALLSALLQALAVPCAAQTGPQQGVYDLDWQLKYYLRDNALYNLDWRVEYYLRDDIVFDKGWIKRYYLKENSLYDLDWHRRYYVREIKPPSP